MAAEQEEEKQEKEQGVDGDQEEVIAKRALQRMDRSKLSFILYRRVKWKMQWNSVLELCTTGNHNISLSCMCTYIYN